MKRLDKFPRLPADPTQRERKLVDLFRDIAETVNALISETMPKAVHSAPITADTLVYTGKCVYWGRTVTVATAVADIDIRDGVAAGGGVVIDSIASGTAKGNDKDKNVGVICNDGLYVDYAAGATGTVVIHYEVAV